MTDYLDNLPTGNRNKVQSLSNNYDLWLSATAWRYDDDIPTTSSRKQISTFNLSSMQNRAPANVVGSTKPVLSSTHQFKMLLETWARKIKPLDKMLDAFKDFIKTTNTNRKRNAFMRDHPDVWTPEAWKSTVWPLRSNKDMTPQQKRLRDHFSNRIVVTFILIFVTFILIFVGYLYTHFCYLCSFFGNLYLCLRSPA